MALTNEELSRLTELLKKVDNTQITGSVWHALIQKFPTVAVEIIVLDDKGRIFLVYRKDQEYDGYHSPGSVWNDWETIPERLQKLIENEIVGNAGMRITQPEPIGWTGSYRGDGIYDNNTRNGCSLLYVARLVGEFVPKPGMGFFYLNQLPKNFLPCQRMILKKVAQYLKDGEVILN